MRQKPRVLFLYSHYSRACKKLSDEIKTNNIRIFTYVNIDDVGSRRSLSKLNVKTLPCIIIKYNKGETEIFQGQDSYEWVEKYMSGIKEHEVKNPEHKGMLRKPKIKQSSASEMQTTNISDLIGKQQSHTLKPKDNKSVMEYAKDMEVSRGDVEHDKGKSQGDDRVITIEPRSEVSDIGNTSDNTFESYM